MATITKVDTTKLSMIITDRVYKEYDKDKSIILLLDKLIKETLDNWIEEQEHQSWEMQRRLTNEYMDEQLGAIPHTC